MLEVFASAGFADDAALRGRHGRGAAVGSRRPPPTAPASTSATTSASRRRCAPFFAPRTVAVLGASPRRGSIGGELFRNVLAADFDGAAFPVNRDGDAGGRRARVRAASTRSRTRSTSPSSACPRPLVLDAVGGALAAGVRAFCVISAGFAETGEAGSGAPGAAARARALLRRAPDRAELPRHRGRRRPPQRDVRPALLPAAAASPSRRRAAPSGSRCWRRPARAGLGLSAFVSVGNKADVSANDLLEWWEDDPETDVDPAVPGVVRQPAQVRPARPPRRPRASRSSRSRAAPRAPARAPRARTPRRWPAPRRPSTRSSGRPA